MNDPWVNRSAGMCCETCCWYVEKKKREGDEPRTERDVGRCRRHAPTMSGYPVVFTTDWCGDHKLNENAV